MIKKFEEFQFRLEDPMVSTLQEIELLSEVGGMSHRFGHIGLCLLCFRAKAVLLLYYAMIWKELEEMHNGMQGTHALPHYAPDCKSEQCECIPNNDQRRGLPC